MRIVFVALLLIIACAVGVPSGPVHAEITTPSAASLASVSALHVGVAYDVVRGSVRNVRLFGGAPKVAMDTFQAKLNVDVREVNTLHHLQQTYASHIGLDLLKGMFVRAPLPFYNPETVNKEEQVACFLSVRSDELVTMQLDPTVMDLSPNLKESIAALPDEYNDSDASTWHEFFEDFGTHWTESAVLGGKLLVSSLTEKKDGITSTDIKRSLAIGIQDWFMLGGDSKMEKSIKDVLSSTSDRITAEGGDNRFIPSTSKDLSRERYQQWVNSVREKPAVVRYRVRSIADLVTGKKRGAMKLAIAAHLGSAYTRWLKEEEERDSILVALKDSHYRVQLELGDLNASIAALRGEKELLVSEIAKQEAGSWKEKYLKEEKDLLDCKRSLERANLKITQLDQRLSKEEKQVTECKERLERANLRLFQMDRKEPAPVQKEAANDNRLLVLQVAAVTFSLVTFLGIPLFFLKFY